MGRASAFADPEIIKMCQQQFVPVTGDDWYQRRRKDREGDFFRGLADALGKKGHTLQGIYLFAADGTGLAYKNTGQSAEATRDMMKQALGQFAKLPEAKRKPGAVKVEDAGTPDANYSRQPPEGGLILKAYTRILDFKEGAYCRGTCKAVGGEKAARDHVWITKDEAKALAPAKAEAGFRYPMPEKVATRLARFHLIDNTRGEPILWRPEDVRALRMTLSVVAATETEVELKLEGEVQLATDADPAKAERGYEARLLGSLRYLPKKGTFDRFDLTAVGTHWGEHPHNSPARPGKGLLGQSFELAGDKPSDRVPPQGIRDKGDYLGTK
ncbi:MAG: hypothetical protein K2V38_09820 [Gemmataceae bacterium]|nr:hypothetical protein [Gemmataceae bacterium]